MNKRTFYLIALTYTCGHGGPAVNTYHHSISSVTVNYHKVWIKGVPEKKQRLSHCIKLKMMAILIPVATIRPTVACGLDSLGIERQRLIEASNAGLRVPQILDDGPDYLILSDKGVSFEQVVNETHSGSRLPLLTLAQQAIQTMHDKGIVHGRGMLKDLVIENGDIGFIDFAENPLQFMTFRQAVARDWICFMYSALPLIDPEQRPLFINQVMDTLSQDTVQRIQDIYQFVKKWQPLIHFLLPNLGHDGQRGLLLINALEHYFKFTALTEIHHSV